VSTAFTKTLAPLPPGRYGFWGIVRSEWTKLRSVRSTLWTLFITVFIGVGLGAIVTSARASRFSSRSVAAQLTFDPTRSSLSGLLFAQLAIGVLGVLVVSAEYSTGTIRDSFAAVPRRSWLLAAKVAVFATITLVIGEVVSFSSFLIGQQILSGKTPTASLSDPSALRAIFGGGLYLFALGLIALGLATIIRHTPTAISAFVGILLILPILASVLPSSYADDIGRFLPADIGTVMISAHREGNGAFNPWVGFALLCGYAVTLLIVGGVLLVRRDA
jgi:ABC-2 type transport system permease protein